LNTAEFGDGIQAIRFVVYEEAGDTVETGPLSVRTVNMQKTNEENYIAGRDFGLTIGVAADLAISLILGYTIFLALRKKN